MRTSTSPAAVGHQPAAEELSWEAPIALHAESRAPRDDEPARGFLLRLHTDPACPSRLVPGGPLVAKRYETAKADALCTECATPLVADATSSVVRQLREAERTLLRLRSRSHEGPMPREMVQCRALRYEAETAVSIHPDAAGLAQLVVELATEVVQELREAMAAYDRNR